MITVKSLVSSRPPVILAYGLAILSVVGVVIGDHEMQAHLHDSAPVAMFLIAVIVTAAFGGARPALLATVLSLFAFFHDLLRGSPPGIAVVMFRVLALAAISCYVIRLTATHRNALESLLTAHEALKRKHEALEQENAERRRTEEQLRASEMKFRALTESAPAAIVIYREDRLVYSNPAVSRITGYSAEELRSRGLCAHITGESASVERSSAEVGAEALPRRYRLELLSKSRERRWLEVTETQVEFDGGPARVCVGVDVTEQQAAAEALSSSRELLQLVLATLPVGVTVTNGQGDIITANAASQTIWGGILVRGQERWAAAKGVWHDSGQRIAPNEWTSARALSEGRARLNELIDIETFDGHPKIIKNSAVPIRTADGRIVGTVIVSEDVTEQVQAQSALRESADRLQRLSRRLLTVQEEERRHLARELHDEFGQLLVGIGMQLSALRRSAPETAGQIIDESMRLIESATVQLRNLIVDLRPSVLDSTDLDAAIKWLTERFARRTSLHLTLIGEIGEVPDILAIGCFRVVQEALTNVARHAGARNVWVEMKRNEAAAEIVVRDDGVGFRVGKTLRAAADRGKFGLIGMAERAQLLGAELVLDAQPGRGTQVRLRMPIPPGETGSPPAP